MFQMIGDHGVEGIVDREPLLERSRDAEVQFGSTDGIDAIEDDISNEIMTEPVPVGGIVLGDHSHGCRRGEICDRFARSDVGDPGDDIGGERVSSDRTSPEQRDGIFRQPRETSSDHGSDRQRHGRRGDIESSRLGHELAELPDE
jgi:hypothetical protein